MHHDTERKIRVLRVITRMNVGGPSLQVGVLCRDLGPRGYETVLVDGRLKDGEKDMGYLLDGCEIERIELATLVNEISPLRDLASLCRIYRIARRFRPDVIHTHHAKAGGLGRVAGWLARVPVRIHTFHGHIFRGHFSPFKAKCYVFAEKLLAKISTKIVAISELQKNDLVGEFGVCAPQDVEVVRLGFDLERFVHADRNEGFLHAVLNLPENIRLVGIVGRLTHVKNHRLFIAAAERLAQVKELEDVRFVIVGDGELAPELAATVEAKGLTGRVLFHPTVREVERVFADLDVLALCSHSEGTPVTVIEAMASGTPVVATRVGGVPDVVAADAGLLVAPGNPEKLAAAIRATLMRPADELARQVRAAGDFVERNFSKDRLVADLDRLYRKTLYEKGVIR